MSASVKNIHLIGLLGGLDEFMHMGCLIHLWLLVDGDHDDDLLSNA